MPTWAALQAQLPVCVSCDPPSFAGLNTTPVQGRDLNEEGLRRLVREFLDRTEAAGPNASLAVYLSGHAVQLEGENYLLPAHARVSRDSDVPLIGFRISDLIRSLSASAHHVAVVSVDAARTFSLASSGQPVAQGLARW